MSAIKSNPGNAVTPVVGEALHDLGVVLYLDHNWKRRFSSAIGYSRVDIDNSDGQAANAYKNGEYFSGNLLCTPAKNVMMGGEFQCGAPRKQFGRLRGQRLPPAVLVQVQLLRYKVGG